MEARPTNEATRVPRRGLRSFTVGATGALVVALAITGLSLVGAGAQEPTDTTPETTTPDTTEEADWAAYDLCMDTQLGGDPFAAADQACADQLPAEIQADMAAWDEYDICVEATGAYDDPGLWGSSVVSVDTPDGFQTIDLGSGPATVTITSDGTSVSVTATGDATIVDEATLDAQWAELDQAIAACDPLLPAEFQNEPSEFPFGSDEALSTYAKG